MKSMTGYGHSIYKSSDYILEVEIKSYNNRYLDISHTINPLLSSYETYVDEEIKKTVSRGHLDVSLKLKTLSMPSELVLDENLLTQYKNSIERISSLTGAALPDAGFYTTLEGVISNTRTVDQDYYKEGVESAVREALAMLLENKKREGEGTKKDLEKLGAKFKASLEIILSKKDEMEEYFKKILLEKYEELLGEKGKDDPRFLSEVAALLVKYSINEECSRLKVHLSEYDKLLESDESVGKKLDFLCQEMNREINTTASKSQMVEINLEVVKMKDALEDIREQARNIE
ncbi:MAG: YicC family protein [Spirochaetales bacterium]|nr:YicC family protein [Spirochaetales bacterium]